MGFSLHRQTGLIHHDRAKSYPGFTVYAVLGGDATYLLNNNGEVVHRWTPPAGWQPYYGHLLPSGHLLLRCVTGQERWEGGGISAGVVELDWDSRVLWQHFDPALHHDHARLTNGNTMVIASEVIPADVAARVRAAVTPVSGVHAEGEMLGDALHEIAPDGSLVWQWHGFEALDPAIDLRCPLEAGGHEWTHCNAVEELPGGDLLLSFRSTSTILRVERATGRVAWRWGKGVLSHQHNPTMLANGHILVFNNGEHRAGMPHSDVVEMDPATGEVVWRFRESPTVGFFSPSISGAQRLPNGNTLICEGRCGRLFEVTLAGEVVWEFVAPQHFPLRQDPRQNAIFRAYRYAADAPELAGRL